MASPDAILMYKIFKVKWPNLGTRAQHQIFRKIFLLLRSSASFIIQVYRFQLTNMVVTKTVLDCSVQVAEWTFRGL
uniref:Uncharacterized protein n=1 Tax=Pararge aegeria TaxID=116150 RepID=S4NY01_9NEOP